MNFENKKGKILKKKILSAYLKILNIYGKNGNVKNFKRKLQFQS